jgi:hypothetical protein
MNRAPALGRAGQHASASLARRRGRRVPHRIASFVARRNPAQPRLDGGRQRRVTKTTGLFVMALISFAFRTISIVYGAWDSRKLHARAQGKNGNVDETPKSRQPSQPGALELGALSPPLAAAATSLGIGPLPAELADGSGTDSASPTARRPRHGMAESCEGEISNQRLGFVARFGDGPGFAYGRALSCWESPDHRQLRFMSARSMTASSSRIFTARRRWRSRCGRAALRQAFRRAIELPRGSLFPTGTCGRLLEVPQGRGGREPRRLRRLGSRAEPHHRRHRPAKQVEKEADASGEQRWPGASPITMPAAPDTGRHSRSPSSSAIAASARSRAGLW